MSKLPQTVLGFAMVLAGIAGWLALPDRSEWVAVILILVGGNFVSQSTMAATLSSALDAVRSWRARRSQAT